MALAGYEPTIPVSERPQIQAIAIGISKKLLNETHFNHLTSFFFFFFDSETLKVPVT